jgi:thiosulfate/3-mercaptopyruvate sulfurtransferase
MDPLIRCQELAQPAAPGTRRVCVDCRSDIMRPDWGRASFLDSHIPGARFADLNEDLSGPMTPASGRHPLPDAQRFARWLGSQGIDATTHVVAYDQGPGPYAARLWWLLRSLGHARVQVLDGGLAAWCAAGLPVASGAPGVVRARSYAMRPFAGWLGVAELQQALARDELLLVDARPADRFAGQNEVIDPVAGHVPGALNRPFLSNLGQDGRFLPAATLRAQWQQLMGARAPSSVVAMCGSGVTACHLLLSLEIAGHALGTREGARLYAGSFSEWIRDPARPVATGAARE